MNRRRSVLVVATLAIAALVLAVPPWGVPPSLWSASRTTVWVGRQQLHVVRNPGNGMAGIGDLGSLDAMLFELPEASRPGPGVGWQMQDVPIPLEIAFFDASRRLIELQRMEPCPTAPCPVYDAAQPYMWVLETEVGVLSVEEGAYLSIEDRPSK